MRFSEVEICNFLAIGSAKFTLDQLGLVHVAGENNDETSADSNGSGKSSIGDAIGWCCWGTTARGVSGDEVVNTAAGKGCFVGITVDDEADRYRIVRHRKDGKHKNALELFQWDAPTSEWVDRTKGTSALTQKAIERILGCSEEVFNAAVYSGQENIPDIPRMTDRQLKVLVEQAAGIDVLTNAYEIARTHLRGKQQERADAQIAFDRATERHQDAIVSTQRLSDQKTQWDQAQKVKISNLKRETTEALANFNQENAAFDASGEDKVLESIGVCEANIAAVNDERLREQVLSQDVTQAQTAASRAGASVAIAERTGKDAAKRYQDSLVHIDQAKQGIGQPCPSCSRPLEGDHLKAAVTRAEEASTQAKAALQTAGAALAEAKSKEAIAVKMQENATKALSDHRATMTDVSAEGDKLRNLQRELQLIRAHKGEIERLRSRAQDIAATWKREAALENPFITMIEEGQNDLIARAETVEQTDTARAEKITEEKYAQAVVDVYAPNGVRAHRLDEATPFLNDRTSHYLGSLADGAIEAYWTTISENKAKDKLVERFSVTVEKQGSAPSFNALSGGEKRKVRLACALALQDLVATRAAKNIELWLGDEIDDALDTAGLERLMGVLEEKARERGTVLVISHNDIAHYARRTMTVTKKAGRAEVVLN